MPKGTTVYFLSREGFKKGKIKSITLNEDSLTPSYRVTCDDYSQRYEGDYKYEGELWTSYNDMFEFFKTNFIP